MSLQETFPDELPGWQSRTRLLVGDENVCRLQRSHVLIVGLGGVGGVVAEMLVRAGVGELTLVDGDVIQESNLNRQLIATTDTIGKPKALVWQERLQAIAPSVRLHPQVRFLSEEDTEALCTQAHYDFVVDAIDTLAPKASLIHTLHRLSIPFASSMGAGARMDPSQVRVDRMDRVSHCGLARALRRRLRQRGVPLSFRVVYSGEPPRRGATVDICHERNKRSTSGTISYLPAVFGCHLAAEAVTSLLGKSSQSAH